MCFHGAKKYYNLKLKLFFIYMTINTNICSIIINKLFIYSLNINKKILINTI
jgi:hypothetical protein